MGASVAAALLDDHFLMMPQGQVIVLVVQHGQWAEAHWHTGRARPSVRMVMSQKALKVIRIIHMNGSATVQKLNIV